MVHAILFSTRVKVAPLICQCLFVALVLSASSAHSQRFHRDDLDYLFAAFHCPDSAQRRPVPDCSKIVEWRIIKPGADSLRRTVKFSRSKLWVYFPQRPGPEDGQIKKDWRGLPTHGCNDCEFRIMMDMFGHESQRNVLTLWQKVGADSVAFVCGQGDGFNTGIGFGRVRWVTLLPDGSFLLIAELGGEGYQSFSFYRGQSPCHFERFYSRMLDWNDTEIRTARVSYTFDELVWPDHHVTEVVEYIHSERLPPRGFKVVVDSATARVLDLWQLARDYFQLDSLK